jgi:hypothetical protein
VDLITEAMEVENALGAIVDLVIVVAVRGMNAECRLVSRQTGSPPFSRYMLRGILTIPMGWDVEVDRSSLIDHGLGSSLV